jgi:carboxymethylenebutenolidase
MKGAGKDLTVHWYEADHAFANPSGGRYDAEDAQTAWTRTLEFLERHLG